MTNLQTYELANALNLSEAMELYEALQSALKAMADYGADDVHMIEISKLSLVALNEKTAALKAKIHEDGREGNPNG